MQNHLAAFTVLFLSLMKPNKSLGANINDKFKDQFVAIFGRTYTGQNPDYRTIMGALSRDMDLESVRKTLYKTFFNEKINCKEAWRSVKQLDPLEKQNVCRMFYIIVFGHEAAVVSIEKSINGERTKNPYDPQPNYPKIVGMMLKFWGSIDDSGEKRREVRENGRRIIPDQSQNLENEAMKLEDFDVAISQRSQERNNIRYFHPEPRKGQRMLPVSF